MDTTTIKQFYETIFGAICPDLDFILSENIHKDIGHSPTLLKESWNWDLLLMVIFKNLEIKRPP